MKATSTHTTWTAWLTTAVVLAAAAFTAGTANAGNGGGGGNGGGQRSTSRSMGLSQGNPNTKYMKSPGSNFSAQNLSSQNFSTSKYSSNFSNNNSLNNNTTKNFKTEKFTQSTGTGVNAPSNNNQNHAFTKVKTSSLPTTALNSNTSGVKNKSKTINTTVNPLHGNIQNVVKNPIKVNPIDPGSGNGVGPGKSTPIDSGIGNGKPPIVVNHIGNHNWNNLYCFPGNKYNNLLWWGWPHYGCVPPIVVTPGYYPPSFIYPYPLTTAQYVTVASRTSTPAPLIVGSDLQLVDVRLLDSGRPDEQIGPRYRVSFRNAGGKPVDHEFNVSLVAATEMKVSEDLPQTISRVGKVLGTAVNYVDLRLPPSAFQMTTVSGDTTEFSKLLVFVDSYQEVRDVNRENNMAGLDRTTIKLAE